MKVSKSWLKELVNLTIPVEEIERLLPLRTIATKEITPDFIELDMKGYNRADLLSMRGVAYEIASITDSKINFTEPDENEYIWVGQNLPNVKVKILDDNLCPLYCVAKISGLKVEKSSREIVKKLEDSGMRSINNVADITNIIMLEYGQPLHAFDEAKVEDSTIIVRRAKQDEKIRTLDNKIRILSKEMLVLADPKQAIGIAGVMGGKTSEVSETTTSILLEAAIFEPVNLRKSANELSLQSEASKRFYHGLTKIRLLQALDAAIRQYQKIGGKLKTITITGDFKDTDHDIILTHKKVNSLIGVDIDKEFIEEALSKLNFEVSRTVIPAEAGTQGKNGSSGPKSGTTEKAEWMTTNQWKVMPPYWRQDIEIEEDLIEEVARIYGYEKILAIPLGGLEPKKVEQKNFELISQFKQELVKMGLTEVQTYSFYSTQVLNNIGFNNQNKQILIKVANPISSETEYLRQNIWPNLVEVVNKNVRQGFKDIAIFEVGKVYNLSGSTFQEEYRLSIAVMNKTDNPIQELNQIFSQINDKLSLKLLVKEEKDNSGLELFHPNRFLQISNDGQNLGGMAEVHQRVSDKFGIAKRVAVLEISLKYLLS